MPQRWEDLEAVVSCWVMGPSTGCNHKIGSSAQGHLTASQSLCWG